MKDGKSKSRKALTHDSERHQSAYPDRLVSVTSGSIRSRVKLKNLALEFQGPGETKQAKPSQTQIHPKRKKKPRIKFLSGMHETAAHLIENSEVNGKRKSKEEEAVTTQIK